MRVMKWSRLPALWNFLSLASITASLAGEWSLNEPIQLNGRTVTLTRLECLPYVESDYTRRYRFDSASNPKLKELRERYRLDEVVASGKDEFERQVILMDWVHRRFKKFGHPSAPARGALEVLKGIDDGHTFFCKQYGEVMVSAAASLGWVNRPLALRRHRGVNKVGGSTEHTTTEIWSNQYGKWIMLDPTSNLYLEKDGVPLNAWEIRQEWFYRDGRDLVFVVGQHGQRYRKADLPIFLQRFEGFGDLTFEPDELDKYGFIGYIPNTDIMDAGYDYGGMWIVKDSLCDGTQWHTRDLPANPASDTYFPLGLAAMELTADGGRIHVAFKTLTPNFDRFEIRVDGGAWRPVGEDFTWDVHPGMNRLEARTVNAFEVMGAIALAELTVND